MLQLDSSLSERLIACYHSLLVCRQWCTSCDEYECFSVNNTRRTWNPAVRGALIADGPSCVVRWTFIYFTTSWIDSEHLQRAGPAPAKLMCVYTPGRPGEKRTTGETRPRGPLPITNTLAVLLNPPKKSQKSRQIHHFCIWSLSPRCRLITKSIAQSLFGTGGTGPTVAELQLWLDLSPQPSGEVAGGNLFSHRLGLRVLPNTDNWWSAGVRQRCSIMRILTSI